MKRAGFTGDHQTGSHTIMLNSRGIRIVVPMHAREMKRGLLMDLLKHVGLTSDEYRKL